MTPASLIEDVSAASPVRVRLGSATLLPDLSSDELDALRESMREHGQLVPVLVTSAGQIVDGRHRLAICRELGLKPRLVRLDAGSTDAEHLGLAVNVARRQLTMEARRRLAEYELQRDPARSDRAIAVAVGLSHPTIGKVRRTLQARRRLRVASKRTGRDGRVQRVGAQRRKLEHVDDSANDRPPESPPEPTRDRAEGDWSPEIRVRDWPAELMKSAGEWLACEVRLVPAASGYSLDVRELRS